METVQQFDLTIEQDNGEFAKVTVSRDYMDLCFRSAKGIVDRIPDEVTCGEDVAKAIEEITTDHNMRNVIGKMVHDLMEIKALELSAKYVIRDTLTELLRDVLGK